MKKTVLIAGLLLCLGLRARAQQDLLPDITIWPEQLYDNSIDTTQSPGHTLLRLSTGTPNIGIGRLELRAAGQTTNGNRLVNQRIYRSNNTYWERRAGEFNYHPTHNHVHFVDWCVYRLRTVGPNDSVGAVIATGRKTSFCILDLQVYNNTQPGFHNPGYYSTCADLIQGLTPGWADIYSKNLTDQWIDITGIPNGRYWLEAEVDPNNLILEADETNNIGRIIVTVGAPPTPTADAYEVNNTVAQVDARPQKGKNSPNLGTVNYVRSISNLSIHTNSDVDVFKFRLNRTGTAADYVGIDPQVSADSDIDLYLLNANGQEIAQSVSGTNSERISLQNRPAGWYYVRVLPYRGLLSAYKLTIDPAANSAPSIAVTAPAADVWVEEAIETFPVLWTASDVENDPMRVTLFRCANNTTLDKSAGIIGGYEALPAENGVTNVNTAEMPLGRWYLYAKVSDGGGSSGVYAPGAFVIYKKGDLDRNGVVDMEDWYGFEKYLEFPEDLMDQMINHGWDKILDMDRNGQVEDMDIEHFYMMTHGG